MAIDEFAPYAAIIVTLIVWTLTQRANRRHEIFKERLRRRVEMFDAILPDIAKFVIAITEYNKDNYSKKAAEACEEACIVLGVHRIKMLCYGTDKEQKAYEEYVNAINERNLKLLKEKNNTLVELVRLNLRRELHLK